MHSLEITLSTERLSALIGSIYDCALDPGHWPDVSSELLAVTASAAGGVLVHDINSTQMLRLADHGFEQSFWPVQAQYGHESPLIGAAMLAGVGKVVTMAEATSDEDLLASRYYRECGAPFGFRDGMGLLVFRSHRRLAMSGVVRRDTQPRYGAADIRLMKVLAPHICRSFAISEALDLKTVRSDILEAMLDQLTVGVYLIDRQGRVAYLNAAAERQIASGDAIRITDQRLHPTDKAAAERLAHMTVHAEHEDALLSIDGGTIALPSAAGAGFIASVLPVGNGARRHVLAPFAAVCAVFVQDPATGPALPGEELARLYGLTAAELRVLMTMATGLAIKPAAEMLGIAEQTAKTHLHRVFTKTGTSRQAELLQLLARSIPPVNGKPDGTA